MLTSGFAETSIDSRFEVRQCAAKTEYDYESDSDLEDWKDDDVDDDSDVLTAASSTGSRGSHKGEPKADSIPTIPPVAEAGSPTASLRRHQIFIPNMAYKTHASLIIAFPAKMQCGR